MPPRKATAQRALPTRTTRRSAQPHSDVPQVFRELLAEAARADPDGYYSDGRGTRPVKRQKVCEEPETTIDDLFNSPPPEQPAERTDDAILGSARPHQIVFDDFEGSDESDVEFEDVELEPGVGEETLVDDEQPQQEPMRIDLDKTSLVVPRKAIQRRKPITKAERDFRLDVHKWHVMSLMVHALERSTWCDREELHTHLKKLVPRKVINMIHMDDSKPSYQVNYSFMKGIEEICAIWRQTWNINARGLRRAYWKDGVDAQEEFDEAEDPIDFDDFASAVRTLRGSRDLGAQLFCALLRALALETRLVFSLQPLPFSGAGKAQMTEPSNLSPYINAGNQSYSDSSKSRSKMQSKKQKKVKDSPFPVFWVEVLNPATTTWIPLDPLVRNTINKPKTQFEPPASDLLNSMTYVLAFEDDRTVHDVTRRYTQWYNAKTRKSRVESTKNGEEWWRLVLKRFRRRFSLPRDQVEREQLGQRSAAEGMPKNVVDFKNHPVYVLERHLRTNEVIHPMIEVGKFSAGMGKNAKTESVYRRQNVHVCRSADAWYRRGRDLKTGEQPLKRVVPKVGKSGRPTDVDDMEDEDEERAGVSLYAEYQTQLYEPPAVEAGRIPRNVYGNLDVYVPSMIPAGAVHIGHPLAAQAAKVLEVDYADAVTGFKFKGRQGTAVIDGVIVALQYTAAVVATIEGVEWMGTQEVQAARSKIVVGIWKQMLTALRVRQRIEDEYGENKTPDSQDGHDFDNADSTYEEEMEEDGGGFMLDAQETRERVEEQAIDLQTLKSNLPTVLPDEVISIPARVTKSPHQHVEKPLPATKIPKANYQGSNVVGARGDALMPDPDFKMKGGDFFVDGHGASENEEYLRYQESGHSGNEDGGGGGFMVEDESGIGGGFLPADEDEDEQTHAGMLTTIRQAPDTKSRENPSHGATNEVHVPIRLSSTNVGRIDESSPNIGTDINDHAIIPESPSKNLASVLEQDGNNSTASSPSLLSHDPEDDDLEPDWIDDAMDID